MKKEKRKRGQEEKRRKEKNLDFEHGRSMKIADVLEDLRVIFSKECMQEGLACGGVYFFGEV